MVPTIVTAHIFCACQGSRARPERNAQHAGHADWFCYFLWKKCVVFQQMKNNFYLQCHFFENRRSMRMLLFLPYDRSDRTFCSQTKLILKHQKLLLQDVTLRAWVLKNPLIGKDQ